MRRVLWSELIKFRTTRTWIWLIAGIVVFVVLSIISSLVIAGHSGEPRLDTAAGTRNLLSGIGSGLVLVLVLGVLGVTSEYRYNTITATFLAFPQRSRVIAAKLVVYSLVGLSVAVIAAIVGLAIALPGARIKDMPLPKVGLVVQVVGGVLLAHALYGMLGVAVGVLVRNQVAAILGALAWVFIAEGLLVSLLPAVGRWLPGGAASALQGAYNPGGHLLPAWAAVLVLLGYAVALAALSTRCATRDVISD